MQIFVRTALLMRLLKPFKSFESYFWRVTYAKDRARVKYTHPLFFLPGNQSDSSHVIKRVTIRTYLVKFQRLGIGIILYLTAQEVRTPVALFTFRMVGICPAKVSAPASIMPSGAA